MLSNRILKLDKGTLKDRLLKYNILKLLVCMIIIFGGIYLIWSAYYSYFSKKIFTEKEKIFEITAYVLTTKDSGKYYYEMVKEEINEEKLNVILNKISNKTNKSFVANFYFPKANSPKFYLKKNISNEDYTTLFNILKQIDGLGKNIQNGYEMPSDLFKDDTFPVIFEINNPDYHITISRNDVERALAFNLQAMFWTPIIPILGILWLFFSARHTYERQQEEDKRRKNKSKKNQFG